MTNKNLFGFKLVEDLRFAKIYVNERNSIILMQYSANTLVDVDKGNKMAEATYPYVMKGFVFGLTDATAKNIQVTVEARRLFGTNKSMQSTLCHAIILKDLHVRMIAYLYLKLDNPPVPTKVFNNHQRAIDYLEKQKAKQEMNEDKVQIN